MYSVQKNEEIMREWQRRYPELPLIFDGAVNPSRYWSEKTKVVICLKECVMYKEGNPLEGTAKPFKADGRFNSPKDSWSMCEYLNYEGGSDNITIINECKIAQLILDGNIKYSFENPEHRKQILRRIGHIELSKIGGTEYQSEWYQTIIQDNSDLIGKQLSNFDANYYVVCGKPSWNVVKSVLNLDDYKHLEIDVPEHGGKMEFWTNPKNHKTLILMYHPSDAYRFNKQLDMIKTFLEA